MKLFTPSRMIRGLLFACAMASSSIGCEDEDYGDCYEDSEAPLPENLGAIPETLVAADLTLSLDPFLNRDFMPISPRGGKPLIAIIRLVEVDSLALPTWLTMDHIWIVRGPSEYWSAEFSLESGLATPVFAQERVARCGPKWDPGIQVDVIVSLKGLAAEPRYLKASNVVINESS